MRIRRRCVRRGHLWVESIDGFRPAYQFCARLGCDAFRSDPALPASIRIVLDRDRRSP